MAKRRADEPEDSDIDVSSTDSENELEDEQQQGEEGEDIINVDFDYFDLNPDVDFHAIKNFLRQLFGDDATTFDVSSLADLILTKNSVGTTIKTEGIESDPFAILSVINMTENINKPCLKTVVDYVLQKTSKNLEFNLMLRKLLESKDQKATGSSKSLKVGLIISERMINMPVEVVPPMYKMLLEEMTKAEDAHEKYEFDYFLVISKVYKLVSAKVQDAEAPQKSKKKKVATNEPVPVEMDYFHYEDMVLEENAKYFATYDYNEARQDTDSRRVFTDYGIDPKLSLILIDKNKLAESIPQMEEKFPPF